MLTAVRRVWKGVTWRRLLTAQAVALGLALLQWSGDGATLRAAVPSTWIFVHFTFWALSALFIVPTTLRADEAVQGGAKPLWAYSRGMAIAVLASLSITGAAACVVLGYGRVWSRPQYLANARLSALYVRLVMEMCFTGGLALLCRVNQHLARQILIYIQDVESRRTALERGLTDSRLAIAEAQMDPTELLRALMDIRGDLQDAAAQSADGKLDELIMKLRRAMSRTLMASEQGVIQP